MTQAPSAGEAVRRIHRRRFGRLLAPALFGAAILVGVLVLMEDEKGEKGAGGYRDGPLDTSESNGLTIPVPVDRPETYGVPVVFNSGDQPVTLRRASFSRPTPGLEVLDVMVAGSERGPALVSSDARYADDPRGFLDFEDLHSIEGFRVEPTSDPVGERGVELVFVFRARRKGSYESRGVDVEYEVGGEQYREVFPNSLRTCVGDPPVAKIPECGTAKQGLELPKD